MTKLQRKKIVDIREKSTVKQNLFVKNLNAEVTVEDLKKVFGEFGEVTSAALQVPKTDVSGKYAST